MPEFVVPESLAGERLDRAVALWSGWSRAEVQALIDAGDVTVDGASVAKAHRLEAGAVVVVDGEPATAEAPTADPSVEVTVVHEDADVVVVDKPADLVVHPGAGHDAGTLVHGLLARFPEIAAIGDAARPGIVHRLDRDTSGLMVVARSARAHAALVDALAARAVDRGYAALCWGAMSAVRGVIDAPIGRSQTRRTRMAVRERGRAARTHFVVVAHWRRPGVTRLDCRLETGRTHQIRVHLAATGHPIVGDATYGGSRESLPLRRPFLHAATLSFAHPVSGERLSFTSPLPADLQRVLDDLGAPDARAF
jgi:23S rRNA pseudouridine1911/1915/1917 synthase